MRKRLSILNAIEVLYIIALLILSLFAVLYTKKLSIISNGHQNKNEVYEIFLHEHFLNPFNQEEMEVLDSLSKEDKTKVLLFCPDGACSSCVIETLQTLLNEGYGSEDVSIYFERENHRMVNESRMRGFHNTHMVDKSVCLSMTSILIRKIDNVGIFYYLKLPSSNNYVLQLFLRYSLVAGDTYM